MIEHRRGDAELPVHQGLNYEEATFPFICPSPAWRAPFTGSDNTTTVAWSFRESSTINPVVADLLIIQSLVNRQFCITPSVFYHPGPSTPWRMTRPENLSWT